MDSIRIETGEKRIAINDDPNRVIVFNPQDIVFAERFYALLSEFQAKQVEYQKRAEQIDANSALDENGIPANVVDGMAFLREVCEFMRGKIDHLFGAGTSQKAFGDTLALDVFEQFFTGITPFIKTAREAKILRYTNAKHAGKVMK